MTPPSSSSCGCVAEDLYQAEKVRLLLRAGRAVEERMLGGGGKEGAMMGGCEVVVMRVGAEEERWRWSRRQRRALRRVSRVYSEGKAAMAAALIVDVRDGRVSVSNAVSPSVSGAEITILSGSRALGEISIGKVVDALSNRVGCIRK